MRNNLKLLLRVVATSLVIFIVPYLLINFTLVIFNSIVYAAIIAGFCMLLFCIFAATIVGAYSQLTFSTVSFFLLVLFVPFYAGPMFGVKAYEATNLYGLYGHWNPAVTSDAYNKISKTKGTIGEYSKELNTTTEFSDFTKILTYAYHHKGFSLWQTLAFLFSVFFFTLSSGILKIQQCSVKVTGKKRIRVNCADRYEEIKF